MGESGNTLYGTWMLIRREVARYMNVWGQTLIPSLASAALFLFVFGHALGARIGDFNGVDYLTFIVPGLVVQGALTNAYSNTASSLFDARRAGYIEDVLTSPLRDREVVIAYAASGATRGIIIGVLTLLIALPAAESISLRPFLFLSILTLACVVFSLLGLLAGLYATRWDHIFIPVTFVLTPLTFLGGVFYPVSELPGALETASRFNPIYYVVDAQRTATLGSGDLPPVTIAMGLLLLAWLLYFWVLRRFQTSDRLRG